MTTYATIVVTYDETLVSDKFLAEHLSELEGVEAVTITDVDAV